MPNHLRYTISFPPSDQDLISFIEKRKKTQSFSFSAYVRDLIRKDMSSKQEIPNLEQIFEYVEKRLRENGFTIKENEDSMKTIMDEMDKEVILNLF
ncbi:hypothetical protein [Heyndrickxia ginsengihumi]|uniref:hypothetical protein n=1 Tax=Heyndrickxia ginsengihumi TaxID=363870 RepID=UPI003D1A15DF